MTSEQVDEIIYALRELSFGNGATGKGALEGIALSLGGPGDMLFEGRNVTSGLFAIAEALNNIAEAIKDKK